MDDLWYMSMFNATQYDNIDAFKKDFDAFRKCKKKDLKKYLKENNITYSNKESLNINKLAFLRCGGKDTALARRQPGPRKGKKRSIDNMVDKQLTLGSINLQTKSTTINMAKFDRNELIEFLQDKVKLEIDICDDDLIDLYVEYKFGKSTASMVDILH